LHGTVKCKPGLMCEGVMKPGCDADSWQTFQDMCSPHKPDVSYSHSNQGILTRLLMLRKILSN